MTTWMLRLQGVICRVLSGTFNVTKIVSCKLPLVSMRVTAIQSRFFSFILFFLLLSPAMEMELSYFCMGARWMRLSLLLAVLFTTGHWHNTAIFFLNKIKLYSIISLTWVFERNVQCYLFIQKSAKREASSCFEGPPAGKLSNPVIIRI